MNSYKTASQFAAEMKEIDEITQLRNCAEESRRTHGRTFSFSHLVDAANYEAQAAALEAKYDARKGEEA
jgi:hypothetical protein